ncbi:LysR family transcriptional regulator [Paenibacillus thermotolerans]|uniref:LysR family transcriptional regulator n=1 Tax=Paenibacillus thermotolerans TaxID=3027807 RepID=UPI0023688FFA|nr:MULTISPECIES: LysR family transcriptional regulator [unclassified Paenibacillus]
MDIRQLTYFIEVARFLSFTKAAEHLHITQPTLSKMIKTMEEELGVALFDRSGKHVELTDAGEAILRSAKHIVKSLDELSAELNNLMKIKKGKLRLGIPPMIGGYFFSSVIDRFHKAYPHIQLQLVEKGGRRIESDVVHGELDAGLVILPVGDESKFHIMPCLEENLMLVAHAGHPLGERKKVQLLELENESFIMFHEDFTVHHLIKDACLDAGFNPQIVFESSQWDFMTELAATGFGIALLPEGICRTLDSRRFRTVPLVQPSIPWRLSMIWTKDKYMSFAAREWVKFMETQGFSAPEKP